MATRPLPGTNPLDQLRDRLLPEDPPAEPEGPGLWIWLGLVAALSLGLVWLLLRRRTRTPARPLPADHIALRDLNQLEARGMPGLDEFDTFHVRLTEILRGYLESRFGLPATRQTTSEFLEGCSASLPLATEECARLAEVLHRCDQAKFARAQSGPEVCRGTLQQVRKLIESMSRTSTTSG